MSHGHLIAQLREDVDGRIQLTVEDYDGGRLDPEVIDEVGGRTVEISPKALAMLVDLANTWHDTAERAMRIGVVDREPLRDRLLAPIVGKLADLLGWVDRLLDALLTGLTVAALLALLLILGAAAFGVVPWSALLVGGPSIAGGWLLLALILSLIVGDE